MLWKGLIPLQLNSCTTGRIIEKGNMFTKFCYQIIDVVKILWAVQLNIRLYNAKYIDSHPLIRESNHIHQTTITLQNSYAIR